MIKKINFLFITLFGIGKLKKIPGSYASLVTTIFLFFLFNILNLSPNIVLIGILIIFFIALYSVNIFVKDLDNKDPKEVVIDEFIGQSIPLYLYEISHDQNKDEFEAMIFYVVIFVLFRFFDIMKPYPINIIDSKLKNTYGILLDDIMAGIYTVITLILFMIFKSIFL